MKIVMLGTGTPAPSLERQCSGYLIDTGQDVIVMDHGYGAHHRLLEAGYRPTDVTHVFLSHVHYDHIGDYPRLIMQHWDIGAGKTAELNVFGPHPIERLTQAIIGPDGFLGPDIDARLNHQVVEGQGWKIRVGEASHVQPFMECLAFRLESEEGVVVYSGDSGGAPQSMIDLAKDCDILIHMCHFPTGLEPTAEYRRATGNHMDVSEIAAKAEVKCLVLTHMIPLLYRPGVKERMLFDISRVYRGPVILGEDLMEIPLKVKYPHIVD